MGALTVDPALLRWAAEQVVRQHTEQPPTMMWKDPVASSPVLVCWRATGRCGMCGDHGCPMLAWARRELAPTRPAASIS